MFFRIGANNFDFERGCVGALGDGEPGVAGDLERVYGVGDDGEAEAEVVFSEGVGDAIALFVDGRIWPAVFDATDADGLFDGVDAEVERAEAAGEFAGDGGFARGWEAREDDQHGVAACHVSKWASSFGESFSGSLTRYRADVSLRSVSLHARRRHHSQKT